jgi:hypothetical protein
MSITEQLSQILDQYYDPQKNLKNIEEKNVDFADNGTLKKINFLEQNMMTKSPLKQGQQNFNQELEKLNFKKAEHDFDRAKHDFEFEKKYKPLILMWSAGILIGFLVWLFGIFTLDYFIHINEPQNRLSNPVVIALATSTVVAIIGLPSLIVKSLFK